MKLIQPMKPLNFYVRIAAATATIGTAIGVPLAHILTR